MDSTIDLSDPTKALDLANIRYQLIRLEDSIIFYLIERAQFPLNPTIYKPNAIKIPSFSGSFADWLLLQQEQMHARVRRYEAPDEYPFFPNDLPNPILRSLTYPKLLHSNTVNINDEIKRCYIENILPAVCQPGMDRGESQENYGSCATMDINCLQALSRRIHFGKFVAEVKFREKEEKFTQMIKEKDVKGLDAAITNSKVEEQVLRRLELKARTFGCDPSMVEEAESGKIDVKAVVNMYKDWVIPLTKEVEVAYLLQRLEPDNRTSESST